MPENSKELEPICVPTECDKNETRFMDICFPVPNCKDEEFVRFIWNTNKAECAKGQLISKGLFVFFNCRLGQKLTFSRSFFGRIEDTEISFRD